MKIEIDICFNAPRKDGVAQLNMTMLRFSRMARLSDLLHSVFDLAISFGSLFDIFVALCLIFLIELLIARVPHPAGHAVMAISTPFYPLSTGGEMRVKPN